MKSAQMYCISLIIVCLLVGLSSSSGAVEPSVTLINNEGETLRGNLTRVRNNHVRLKASSFGIKISLNAVNAIHFVRERPSPRNRPAPYLIASDGSVITFRRLIRSTGNGLLLELNDHRRLIPYESVQSVFFGKNEAKYELIYKSTNGNTQTITIDMNNDPIVSSGTNSWITHKQGNKYSCLPANHSGDTRSVDRLELWDLPPSPGTQWPIIQGNQQIGTGGWDKKENQSGSSYSFRLRFRGSNDSDSTVNVTGNFDSTSLIPISLVVDRVDKDEWKLVNVPPERALSPCVTLLLTEETSSI